MVIIMEALRAVMHQFGAECMVEIDLGDEFPIDSVAVWNRTDCCPERLDHLSIQFG